MQVVVSGPAPQTIIEIDEYASWPSSDNLVDGTTDSHLSPSLSQTGLILDNRAGGLIYLHILEIMIVLISGALTMLYLTSVIHL